MRTCVFPGQVFGELRVIAEVSPRVTPKGKSYRRVRCVCSCGVVKEYDLCNIRTTTTSCGCVRDAAIAKRNYKHGFRKHPVRSVWRDMRNRCYRVQADNYERYGGRGITVCAEWLNDLGAFATWALANGWRKELQLDRIDNGGSYSPDNCRFVTRSENARNKSSNRIVEFQGKQAPLVVHCENMGMPYQLVHTRLRRGWSITRALTTKIEVKELRND